MVYLKHSVSSYIDTDFQNSRVGSFFEWLFTGPTNDMFISPAIRPFARPISSFFPPSIIVSLNSIGEDS